MERFKKTNYSIAIFSLIGIIDSGYLSILKLSNNEVKCIAGLGNCDAVNSSSYSVLAGIPVAYLGFISYLIVTGLILFVMKEKKRNSCSNIRPVWSDFFRISVFRLSYLCGIGYSSCSLLFPV